ncbi:hypothetical protein ACVXZ4_08390 [Lacisediminihabitans sp. FW035]
MSVAFTSNPADSVKVDVDKLVGAALAGYAGGAPGRRQVLAALCAALPAGATATEVRFSLLRLGDENVKAIARGARSGLYRQLVRAARGFTLSGSSSLPGAADARAQKVASVSRCLVGILTAPVDPVAVGVSDRMIVSCRHVFAVIGMMEIDHLRATGKHGVLLTRSFVAAKTGRSFEGARDVLNALKKLGWIRKVKDVSGGVGRYRIAAQLTPVQAEAAWVNADVVDALAVGALTTNDGAAIISSAAAPIWMFWEGHLGSRAYVRALAGAVELAEGDRLGLTKQAYGKLAQDLLRDLPGLGELGLDLALYLADLGDRTIATDLAEDRMRELKAQSAARTAALNERRDDAKYVAHIFREVWAREGVGLVPAALESRDTIRAWASAAARELGAEITDPGMRQIGAGLLRRDLVKFGHDDAVAKSIVVFILPPAAAGGVQ